MLRYAFVTEIGNRTLNEDAVRVISVADKRCFIVCDGLGGHDRGDVASRIVANTFADDLCFAESLSDFLPAAFNHSQVKVIDKQKNCASKSKMKTTAVAMATDEKTAYVGHIGDSRFYGFTKDRKCIRTMDHSIPQILVNSNTIEEKDIRNHPSRNMLLKVIGEQFDEGMVDLLDPFPVNDYCAYLLCSDGFWELINEDQMMELLFNSSSPKEWLDQMLQIVEQNGTNTKMDNYSAIAIFNSNI